MTDRRLTAAFAGFAEAVLPDSDLEQSRANAAAIRRDATVRPQALASTLILAVPLRIAGTLTTGTDKSDLLTVMPQRGRLRNIYARARTAPSGGEATIWLTADGADVGSVSLANGASSGISRSLGITLDPGVALDARVAAANGAANVTLTVTYSPAS